MPLALLQTTETVQAVTQLIKAIPGGVWGFFGFLLFLGLCAPWVALMVIGRANARHIGSGLTDLAGATTGMKDMVSDHHAENTGKLVSIEAGVKTSGDQLGVILQRQNEHGTVLTRIEAKLP